MYHYVRPIASSRYPGIKGLEYNDFQQQIDFFTENFNIVSADDVCDALDGKTNLPPRAMLLTFDDGYRDHFDYVLPVLMKYNIRGVFAMPAKILAERRLLDVNKVHFILAAADYKDIIVELKQLIGYYRGKEFDIPSFEDLFAQYAHAFRWDSAEVIFIKRILQTGLPERLRNILADELFDRFVHISEDIFINDLYLTMEQVQMMKNCGMTWGVHGYEHNWIGKLNPVEMQNDINKALDFFKDVLDEKWYMCFPYGSANAESIDYIRKKGAGWGVSTECRIADLKCDDRFFLPRLDTNDFPPKSDNYLNIQ